MDRQDYVKYWQDQTVTNVAVLLHEPARVAEVRQAVVERLGGQTPLRIRSREEFWAELHANYDTFFRMTDGLTWIAILVAGLAIANTLFANILERKQEWGILRAVGARRREILQAVVAEAFATGLVGGATGILAGLALQALFVRSAAFINGVSLDWTTPWAYLGTALLTALVLAPLAGLLPARWASRLDVVDALRYE